MWTEIINYLPRAVEMNKGSSVNTIIGEKGKRIHDLFVNKFVMTTFDSFKYSVVLEKDLGKEITYLMLVYN